MKIAMLAGHSRKEQGADVCAGFYKGMSEWVLSYQYLRSMCEILQESGYEAVLTHRDDAGGKTPRYSALAANATGADIALEWHFNSYEDAHGCEVLYWHKSEKGKKFADLLSERLAALLDIRNRGAKPIGASSEDRGYRAFRDSKMPFFMVEPCFAGSNEEEARKFGDLICTGEWQRRAAKIVAQTIKDIYGLVK